MAFEVFTEESDSEDESDTDSIIQESRRKAQSAPHDASIQSRVSHLGLKDTPEGSKSSPSTDSPRISDNHQASLPPIKTSLSLLEMLLRLVSLQQFQQTPHLSIPDELLTFFLSESASTGAASNDAQERKRLREEARRHVGFDPYDESPVKRRGEEYQYRGREASEDWTDDGHHYTDEKYGSPIGVVSPRHIDEGCNAHSGTNRLNNRPQSMLRERTPESPIPMNRYKSSDRDTGSFQEDSGKRSLTTRRGTHRLQRRQGEAADAARQGSPLTRPEARFTDEGIGKSPSADDESTKEG